MAERDSRIAGTFVPGSQAALDALMSELCGSVAALRDALPGDPVAVVSPHAGYAYSGKLAAAAWSTTARLSPQRIAILSPAHHAFFDGIAVPTGHDAIRLLDRRHRIDTRAVQALIRSGLAYGHDLAFESEHGIDTQLPFARHFHPRVPVVPIVTGRGPTAQVARLIDRLDRMDGQTLFVLSSDLSHFYAQSKATSVDGQAARFLETTQPSLITPIHACGAQALSGWLQSRAGRAARALRLGMHTSYNTTNDAARVVGYGAWALFAPETDILDAASRQTLLTVARQALVSRLNKGLAPVVDAATFAVPLRTYAATFVTLEQAGVLRGCVGSMVPHLSMVEDVAKNAVRAGFDDPRFPPISVTDLRALSISVSVLTQPVALDVADEDALAAALVPGKSGAILMNGSQRGLFLPSVWSSLPDPADFVAGLERKAGLAGRPWDETMQVQVFRAEAFSEAAAVSEVA